MSKGISDKVAELEARINEMEEEDKKFLPPLLEMRCYGYTNKCFFLGLDVSQIATDVELKLDGATGEHFVNITFDLKALSEEIYKDKVNSGLTIK